MHIFTSGIGLLIALAASIAWYVGRTEGDHPHCSRCGFNLFSLDAHQCPECGAYLNGKRAVRTGKRVRSNSLLVTAMLTLTLVGGFWIYQFLNHADDFDWSRYQSTSSLIAQAQNGATFGPKNPSHELYRRLKNGKLGLHEKRQLLDLVMQVQGDRSIPWTGSSWASILHEFMLTPEIFSDHEIESIFRQACDAEMNSSRIEQGILTNLKVLIDRLPHQSQIRYVVASSPLFIDGKMIKQWSTIANDYDAMPGRPFTKNLNNIYLLYNTTIPNKGALAETTVMFEVWLEKPFKTVRYEFQKTLRVPIRNLELPNEEEESADKQ